MRLTEEELKELYREQTARSPRKLKDCLTEEEMVRAAAGELSRAERERVADHLTACSDCAEEYRIASSLKPWAEQVAAASGKPAPKVARFPVRASYTVASYAIAASLVIISLALSAWVVSLRRENHRAAERFNEQLAERDRARAEAEKSLTEARGQLEETPKRAEQYEAKITELNQTIEELSQPQLNIPIADLDPRASIRGDTTSAITIVKVPSGANLFTLILNTAGEQVYSGYALEILDQHGKLIWSGKGLQKTPSGNFTIALSRRLFPAGQYRINLYGLQGGRRRLVEDYSVRIEYQ